MAQPTTTGTKIQAQLVREGDFLPGIDDGYVIDVETTDIRAFSGSYNVSLGVMTAITFNDADGEECFLLLPQESLVAVRPEDGSDPSERTSDEDDDEDEED